MEWTIEYLKEDGIVCVKTYGRISWDENKQMSEEALAVGRKNGVRKFLVDHRQMEHGLSILQVDKLPEMFKQIGVTAEDKVAILFDAASPMSRTFAFFRDTAFIESLRFGVFNDPAEATEWLESDK